MILARPITCLVGALTASADLHLNDAINMHNDAVATAISAPDPSPVDVQPTPAPMEAEPSMAPSE